MIWLVRHGETTWNLAGRYQGRLESALTSLGASQGFALADYFSARVANGEAVPTRAISSPLLRCTATARFVTSRLGIELATDERLIEIGHGTWEGRYKDDLERNDAATYRTWREHPERVNFDGGESLADVIARWRTFAAERLSTSSEDTLVVTHDAVVRCALLDVTARPLADFWNVRVENAAFALLHATNGALELIEECSVDHLAGVRAATAGQAL
jgi:broad specificity phosphatase PhoE